MTLRLIACAVAVFMIALGTLAVTIATVWAAAP